MFTPNLKIGEKIDNEDLHDIFKCSTQGGMRRSHTTNTLVIISDHTSDFYHDIWKGDVLHYTGMGKTGDQVLTGNQNGTLYNSDRNGVSVFLFEKYRNNEYTFKGKVKLAEKPYMADQKDYLGHSRKVWVFPVKPII